MRELAENKLGVHFRPSAHCSYVDGFSANRIPRPAGDCCWHCVSPHVLVTGHPASLARRTVITSVGRIPDHDARVSRAALLFEKSAGSGGAQTTGKCMDDSVETRAVAGPPPSCARWLAPALIAGGRLATAHEAAPRQPEAGLAAFVPGAERAVAPAVGPWAAALRLESGPIPHHTADRGPRVLPTYLRHPEVGA